MVPDSVSDRRRKAETGSPKPSSAASTAARSPVAPYGGAWYCAEQAVRTHRARARRTGKGIAGSEPAVISLAYEETGSVDLGHDEGRGQGAGLGVEPGARGHLQVVEGQGLGELQHRQLARLVAE